MLPRRNGTIRKSTIRNVTIRKCTIRNVTDPCFPYSPAVFIIPGRKEGGGGGIRTRIIRTIISLIIFPSHMFFFSKGIIEREKLRLGGEVETLF